MNISKIPLGEWVDSLVAWVTIAFARFFEIFTDVIDWGLDLIIEVLSVGPPIVLIIVLALLVTYTSKWPLGVFTIISLLLIDNLGYWESTIQTLAIVLVSGFLTILIGIPVGIWCAQNKTVQKIVTPILDFMQTMPAFVYLIPSILFFGIGVVPGIVASFIFAIAPTIRMTNLGIREVPEDLIEASNAFGSTTNQKLFKVQLPLAMPTILAGVNQSIMLALSMVVTASLVGAPGLGADVYRAVSQINVGQGFEAGLSIVIIAIILDRITQNLRKPAYEQVIKPKIVLLIFALLVVVTAVVLAIPQDKAINENTSVIGTQTEYEIIGIEPGAGLMGQAKTAITDYGLEDWTLVEGSSAAMIAELKKAYDAEEPIIVTGWTPHWMFAAYDLKYLEDPKGSFGGAEDINTLVRKGLEQDAPGAYKILDQFIWESSDMESVMVEVSNGSSPAEAAEKWIDDNPDKVAEWTKGAAAGNGESIDLVFVAWDSEIASTNVVGKVLEQNGYDVSYVQVEVGPMFAGVANNSADAMVGAWLPSTHMEYYETYKNDLVDLGPNLQGTKTGLVVPAYVDIDSIEELNEKVNTNANSNKIGVETDYEVIGIEPGAGLMGLAKNAISDYELNNWTLVEGSSAAMAAELKKAYDAEEPIIVTGWTPHWMFSAYDLKYLDDPKGSFGGAEDVNTLVRKGLEQDAPGAYKILDQFFWEPSDMESVMVEVSNGSSPAEAAEKWIDDNPDKVAEWTKGAAAGNGESIDLVFVAWDTEIASTNVVGKVLEQNGYDVSY